MDKEILTLMMEEVRKAFGNHEETLANSIKDYLQGQVYNNVRLQDICDHFHRSKSHICEAFRREMGIGVIEYYNDLKIQEAKRLIDEEKLNLTQIAEKLGYMSIHQFSRSFKNRTGMSPTAYRKLLK